MHLIQTPNKYLQYELNASDSLEGKCKERLETLSLTHWLLLKLLEYKHKVFVLLP